MVEVAGVVVKTKWMVIAAIVLVLSLALAYTTISPSYRRAQEYQELHGEGPIQKPR